MNAQRYEAEKVLPLFRLLDVPTLENTTTVSLLIRTRLSKIPTFSVAIQRVSLDEPVSSAAARSQTSIVLHSEDGTLSDHNHY